MDNLFFSGVLNLPWWGLGIVILVLTHITIVAVTVFLHRHQAHRSLELHPVVSHFFRLWLWMTTGMVTKEWAAVHRKHHAKCETAEDPHSPQLLGINRVLWSGVLLYVRESRKPQTLARYGHGTPDDWIERNIYSKFQVVGITLMGVINVVLFGIVPGLLMLLAQIAWIPFWAAGVINGIGHYWGYRHWSTADTSTNITPWGILIGGEELHNNHHAYPTSARLSCRWYEFDIGWFYIRTMEVAGLASVKHVAPVPQFTGPRAAVDPQTLHAVVTNRYDVLAKYTQSLKRAVADEIGKLRKTSPEDARALKTVKPWLARDEKMLRERERAQIAEALLKSSALHTMYAMRRDLADVWVRSSATREQLVKQLQEWCRRAEDSDIRPLMEFSQRLRSYA